MEMINLLNPADISEIRAARVNVRLRRFAIITFLTVGIIGAIYAVGFQVAASEYSSAVAKTSTAEQKLKDYQDVKQTAQQYKANLSIAKKILGNEITFSTFITDLASSLPANTVLDKFNLSTKSIGVTSGKQITTELSARAKSYNDVLALKTSLEKKTNLFSAVRIDATSISNSSNSDQLAKTYPYTVTFSVVIATQGASK